MKETIVSESGIQSTATAAGFAIPIQRKLLDEIISMIAYTAENGIELEIETRELISEVERRVYQNPDSFGLVHE